MTTALIGAAASQPGNIVPGLGAIPGRRFRRSALQPFYRVQVFEFADSTTFGIGDLLVEFDRPHAIGYGDYLNNVPEAFFSLHQDDPKIRALRGKGGRAHVRIYRGADLVWTGWVSLERDANAVDAIFYCYGYAAGLYWSHTDWDESWSDETVATIVSESWTRAKTTLTKSRLGFIADGVIEAPPTEAGGNTAISLPLYETFYKRHLFLMQEMAAISASDTGASTVFEITHSLTPTFNFWADRARNLTDVRWEYAGGRGVMEDFHEYGMPVYHRNDILAVGQQPRDLILRKEVSDTTDMNDWGRMQESLFLAWVKDEDELERVTNLRAAKAKREDLSLQLTFHAGRETPPGASDSNWRNGDIVPVKIDRGVTNIDGDFQIVGYMVGVLNGIEKINVLIQEPV